MQTTAMRITAFILFFAYFQLSATANAQVTFSGKNVSIERVFNAIKKQTDYLFFYNSELVAKAKPVTINVRNASVEEVLTICFDGQHLTFTIREKIIFIKKREINEALPNQTEGSDKSNDLIEVRGRVVNEKGEPVEGVTVKIKGRNSGTSTNTNGEFILKGVPEDGTLIFSSINIQEIEWEVGGKSEMIVTVRTKIREEQEVEVVYNTGYQSIAKERATGSFVKIDNELFNRKVSSSVLDRIYDIASGLTYTKTTGGGFTVAGGLPALQIRGASTINANKVPLIVVDNFPYQGDIESLNPNDIESITLLKDAAAASIWGIRSGNGVIVITTKKGRLNQRTNVAFNSNITIRQKPNLGYIPLLSSADVIGIQKGQFGDSSFNIYDDLFPIFDYYPVLPEVIEILLAARKGSISQTEANGLIANFQKHDIRDDINKYLLRNSVMQQYALNFSGGGSTYSYYGSIGYDVNEPFEVRNKNTRLSLRVNNLWKPVKAVEIFGEINYVYSLNQSNGISYQNYIPLGLSPVSPYTRLADENGAALAIPYRHRSAYLDTANFPALLDWQFRPLDELNLNPSRSEQRDIRVLTGVNFSLLPYLQVKLQYQNQIGISESLTRRLPQSYYVRNGINSYMNFDGGKIIYPWPMGSVLSFGNNQRKSWNLRFYMDLDRSWGSHNLSVIAGSELQQSKISSAGNILIGFDEELSLAPIVDYTTPIPSRPGGGFSPIFGDNPAYANLNDDLFRNGSYFANAGYRFKNKYLLNASGRLDMSNLFGVKANQRRVPLWSAGVGWIISEESFFKVPWLSNLMLRATYGYNGNASNSASALATIFYRTPNSPDVPSPTYALVRTPNNPQLRWERVKMINVGINFAVLNGAIAGSVEFYNKRGLDLLGDLTNDPTSGWGTYFANYASIKVKGIDFVINTRNYNRIFKWNTSLQISTNSDKVLSYGGQAALSAVTLAGNGAPPQVGQTLYAINSYHWAGLDPNTGAPRIYLGDTISNFNLFGQGKSTDIIHHGSRSPRIFGNILNTFSWKQFSLSFNITYKLKYFFRRSTIQDPNILTGGHIDYTLRWQKPGDEAITNVPAYGTDDRYGIYWNSDILIEKGDHIRFSDIRFNYEMKKSEFKKLPMKSIQIYFYVQNLGIIWKANNKGIDPEAFSFGSLPDPKSYSFGITLNY